MSDTSLASRAPDIAALCLHKSTETHFRVQLQSTEHRIALLSNWEIPKGAKVLELGCGQGDCTAVLAEIVGLNGHVTAVDPGSLDYGSPFNLGQAQAHLSAGRLGPQITWKQADPLAFLSDSAPEPEYDVAVLVLCTWYFASPAVLSATLRALAGRARRLCIAEWALASTRPAAHPHVLAALAQGALERHNPESSANIRTLVAPAGIRAAAAEAGWALAGEATVVPAGHVLDGRWEVQRVESEEFLEEVHRFVKDDRERSVVLASRDATLASAKLIGGRKSVESMDVWCGEFIRS